MPRGTTRAILLFLTLAGAGCAARQESHAPRAAAPEEAPPPEAAAVMPEASGRPVPVEALREALAEGNEEAQGRGAAAPAAPLRQEAVVATAPAAADEAAEEVEVEGLEPADEPEPPPPPPPPALPRFVPPPAPPPAPTSAVGGAQADAKALTKTKTPASEARPADARPGQDPRKASPAKVPPPRVEAPSPTPDAVRTETREAAGQDKETRTFDRLDTLRATADDGDAARLQAQVPGAAPDAFAFGQRGPRPAAPTGTPAPAQLLARDARGGAQALVPRALRVVHYVQGARVRTVLDYVFENPTDQVLQGDLRLELPPDATPSGYTVFEGAQSPLSRARLLPRLPAGFVSPEGAAVAPDKGAGAVTWRGRTAAVVRAEPEARARAEAAVRAGEGAALVAWGGGREFTQRVHPIPPRALQRVVVRFDAPLPYDGRVARLPLALPGGEAMAREQVVFVDGQHGQALGHPPGARVAALGRWTRLDVGTPAPGSALELSVSQAQAVLRGRDPAVGEAFYARVAPPVRGDGPRGTGRAIFMVDTSFSVSDAAAARQAALLDAILAGDPTLSTYAVMLFDVRARWLHGLGLRPNDAAHRAETRAELARAYREGATSLDAAARALEAQRAWAVEGGSTTVFLLSDGQLTWGEDVPARIFATSPALAATRVVAYRFDGDPARAELLDALAARTGGQVVTVPAQGEVTAAAQAHLRAGARLRGVTVVGAPAEDLVVDGEPGQLYPGQGLTVVGRLPKGGQATLRVEYEEGGVARTHEVPLVGADDALAAPGWADVYARGLWAQRDPRLDPVLAALGAHFGLVNPRAAFVVAPEVSAPPPQDILTHLAAATAQAREVERRAAEGLDTAGLDPEVQAFLQSLRRVADGLAPPDEVPLVWAPEAGGGSRAESERLYRATRLTQPTNLVVYERIARVRALAGDTAGALRALSSAVEVDPREPASLRPVAYALLALGQGGAAAEVLARVRRLRPFEPQSYLEEALALEAAGRPDEAALRYELVLARRFPRHQAEVRGAAAALLVRLLARLDAAGLVGGAHARVARRRAQLEAADPGLAEAPDLLVTAHWSQDMVDVDLWAYTPRGERVVPGGPAAADRGRTPWNVADGLGPEQYRLPKATPGAYDTLVHYRRLGAPQVSAPAAVLVAVDRAGAPRRFLTRLLTEEEAVLMLRTEVF